MNLQCKKWKYISLQIHERNISRSINVSKIQKLYCLVANMQIAWLYAEFVCVSVMFVLPGLTPVVIVKQLGPTIVATKYGDLRGALVEFPSDAHVRLDYVEAYLGIQYGSLHGGNLRFIRSSSPNERWNAVRSAWDHKPVCPQPTIRAKQLLRYLPEGTVEWLTRAASFVREQTEDCLYLNLYVPMRDWNETDRLPVMIFVHGESYEVGTGNAYDGSVLASYGGVIVITVNYRLGVLGFLQTGDNKAEGNYALWDLIAILYWVKDNIAKFNGDPNRVTLFGHGHGAALVNLLLFRKEELNDLEKALFSNVILQSGSALSTWATSIDAKRCAHLMAHRVNCSHSVNSSEGLVACFRQKSVEELVRSVPLTPKYFTCFAPSIDKHMKGALFPEDKSLEDLVRSRTTKSFSNTRMMVGLTRKEAYSYLNQSEIQNGISEHRKAQIMRTYVQNVYKYNRQKIYDILEHEYTQWERPESNFSRRDEVMDMLSDGQYKAPLIKMAQEHSKVNDTYFYSFAYSTQSEDFPQWSGGVHGDELPYVFGAPLVGGLSPFPSTYTSQEVELSKFMMRMWTNFAKTGDPNLPEWSSTERDRNNQYFTEERWPKYNQTTQSYLHIGRKGTKVKDFYHGREAALWNQLIPKLNEGDGNSSDASNQLDNAEDMTTFDDPSRLVTKFRSIFPSPPPPPYTLPYTPSLQSDTSRVSRVDETTQETIESSVKPEKHTIGIENKAVGVAKVSKAESNNVPLSVVIVVGCTLLFINLCFFVGMYVQRKRIAKLRSDPRNHQHDSGSGASGNNIRNTDTFSTHAALPEAVNQVHTNDPSQAKKLAAINHKTPLEGPPMYTAISKPVVPSQGPGGYSYSALSQTPSSPMHSQNKSFITNMNKPLTAGGTVPSHIGNTAASSASNSNTVRNPGPDRSPKPDPRAKNVARGNHTLSSNNAITIV
ncbi:neuroligin-4, Y-linked-like isoform X2 [Mya arenaria]|uniref:neuroligin-4, Y-linked-like isoform X2 n=1 Tax=Mya arenaria TaxID=6604 RepID=UPI0022E02061|nr:neuroligin-4, Y-linked-like isoform X2 [Mya arenaria]